MVGRNEVEIREVTEKGHNFYVRLCGKSWLRRVFEVGGVIDAKIEYNALKAGVGYREVSENDDSDRVEHHCILVNGIHVAGARDSAPLPSFELPGASEAPGRLEVLLSYDRLFVQIVWL